MEKNDSIAVFSDPAAVTSSAVTKSPAGPTASTTASAGAGKDAAPQNSTTAPTDQTDAIQNLVTRLHQRTGSLEAQHPGLASTIRQLHADVDRPDQARNAAFLTQVAYALEDTERVAGRLQVAPELRKSLAQVAATVPGLHNDRMHELLTATPSLADSSLVIAIRTAAAAVARNADQDTPDVRSRLDALENRFRLAPVLPALRGGGSPEGDSRRVGPAGAPPGRTAATGVTATAQQSASQSSSEEAERVRSARSQPYKDQARQPANSQERSGGEQRVVQASGPQALINLMRAATLPRPEAARPLPWDRPQDSLADRHGKFEQKMAVRREDEALNGAERAGRAALEALQGFSSGAGAAILTKIQDAAKATPGGMPVVLAEMRDGGKFADLREQFNAALTSERGLGAAYDQAVSALGQYGEKRAGVSEILAQRGAASGLATWFERLDAEIGQAVSALPGREGGKTAFDELGEKAAEIVKKAVETMQRLFGREASASAGSSPSPSSV